MRNIAVRTSMAKVYPYPQPFVLSLTDAAGEALISRIYGENARVTHMAFRDLTPQSFALHKPDTVLSPVILGRHDCLDVALFLDAQGYRGIYRVYGIFEFKTSVLLGDLRSNCPRLDIDVMAIF